ncbi:MAG: lytic transglycosylase, partial [Rhodobacteraceae bacterium]|nr:lytic transglycosylase [Paracoccaceae bacterium]
MLTACILGSCGIVPSGTAPRNLDNACSIVEQRPHYMRAFKATERRWGVPVNVQMAIIHQESRFKANAKTPMRYILGVIPRGRQSSAYGYAQALDGTWE